MGIAVTAVAGLVMTGVTASCGSTPQTNPPDTGAPIHIGISIGLTGDLKGTATGLQNAIRVAEAQINAYGGVLGRKVVYDIQDDQSDQGTIIQGVVNNLLGQHVSALLGPIGSSQVSAVQQLTYQAKTIEITATATSPLLSTDQPATDRYLFRTVPNDNLQAKALAIFAYNGPDSLGDAGTSAPIDAGADGGADGGVAPGGGCRTMVTISNSDDYGTPFKGALKTEFEKLAGSGAVLSQQDVSSNVQPDYSTALQPVQDLHPDCLAMVVYDPTGDEILRELRQKQTGGQISNNLVIIGTDGTYTQDFIVNGQANKGNPASASVAEGVFGTNPDSNPTERGEYGDFQKLYLAQYTLDPGATDLPGQAANQYDAAILAALAIQKAGTTDDPVKIRDSLFAVSRKSTTSVAGITVGPGDIGDALNDLQQGKGINYEGASGDCDFDENGDVVGDYIVWTVVHPAGQQPAFLTIGKIPASALVVAQ
ncbi:MAG: ABC transporter substrate-binding protein [Polyangiaceae bacterium]